VYPACEEFWVYLAFPGLLSTIAVPAGSGRLGCTYLCSSTTPRFASLSLASLQILTRPIASDIAGRVAEDP